MTQAKSLPDIPLEPPLARGRTADIHPWQKGTVLKLFHDWYSLDDIQYEAKIARAVQSGGLPAPRVGDLIQVNGHHGLIYERVDGGSMLAGLRQKPWQIFHYARRLAALHARLHEISIEIDLPSQRQVLVKKIQQVNALTPAVRSAILDRLDQLPDGRQICHGDFHFDNVLLTVRGEMIIDWTDATLGNPLADVARTTILVMGAAASGQVSGRLANGMIRLFQQVYLRQYFHLRPGGQEEYRLWLPIMAAARLEENIPEVESWLIEQAVKPVKVR